MQPCFETSSSLKINPDDGSQIGDPRTVPKKHGFRFGMKRCAGCVTTPPHPSPHQHLLTHNIVNRALAHVDDVI